MAQEAGQRYRCACGTTLTLPERPTDAPESVEAACPGCGRFRQLYAVGSPRHARLVSRDAFGR